MIRRYDVYASVRDSAAQRIAVGLAFDSRIPLDKIPHAGVVGVTEPQVMHAHLVRNPFTGERPPVEKIEFAGRAQVQHVQVRPVARRQFDGLRRRPGNKPRPTGSADASPPLSHRRTQPGNAPY